MANLKLQNKNYVYNELTDNGKKITPDEGYDGLGKVKIRSRWRDPGIFYFSTFENPFYVRGDDYGIICDNANESIWLDRLSNGELYFELQGDFWDGGYYDETRKWTQTYAGKITSDISTEVDEIISSCECGGYLEDYDYIIKFTGSGSDDRALYFARIKDQVVDHLVFHLIGAYCDNYYITYTDLYESVGFIFDLTAFWLDDKFRGPMIELNNDTITGLYEDWVPGAVRYFLSNFKYDLGLNSGFATLQDYNNYTDVHLDVILDNQNNIQSGEGFAVSIDMGYFGAAALCAPRAYKFVIYGGALGNIIWSQELNETNQYTVIPPVDSFYQSGWWGDGSAAIFYRYADLDNLDDHADAKLALGYWEGIASNLNNEINFTGLYSGIYTVTAVDKDGNESGIYNVVANDIEELSI